MTTRNREPSYVISPSEAIERAADLEAQAKLMPAGDARIAVLRQAHSFRALAEMKDYLQTGKSSSPAG